MFTELGVFKKRYGHCNVPVKYTTKPQLGIWVVNQRFNYRSGRLSTDRIGKLEAVGFEWDLRETNWQRLFQELKAFKKREGSCDVPQKWSGNYELGTWVTGLRQSYRQNKLPQEKIRKLETIGFAWDGRESLWQRFYEALLAYKKSEGHCNVPRRYPKNPQLAAWVSIQRVFYSKGKLAKERIQKLEAAGLQWNRRESEWQHSYEGLLEFNRKHGHCNIPAKYAKNPQLGSWVFLQRQYYHEAKLSRAKFKLLDSIGFEWDPLETFWQQMFEELKSFRKKNGHCNVPAKYPDCPQLGRWVNRQRNCFVNAKLSKERIQKLLAAGFEWDPHAIFWEKMFEELKIFKGKNGHCIVPYNYSRCPQLGTWIRSQRRRKSGLSNERIRRLESLGFE